MSTITGRHVAAKAYLASLTLHAQSSRDERDRLIRLGEPGVPLWIVCNGWGYEAVSDGLVINAVEALFGNDPVRRWLISWRDAAGATDSGRRCVAREDAERAWWVLDGDGSVVAGGPPIFDETRALEIAARYHGKVVQGTTEIARCPR